MGRRRRLSFRRSGRRSGDRRRCRGRRMPHRRRRFFRRRRSDCLGRRFNRRLGRGFHFRFDNFRRGHFRLCLGRYLGGGRGISRRWWRVARNGFRRDQPWSLGRSSYGLLHFRLGWRRWRNRRRVNCRSFGLGSRRMHYGPRGRRRRRGWLCGRSRRSRGTRRYRRTRRNMRLHLLADRLQHISRLGDVGQIELRLDLVFFVRMGARPGGRSLRLRLSGVISSHLLRFFD